MRILCLADLHFHLIPSAKQTWIQELVESLDFDVVVVAGDIFEADSPLDPYAALSSLFKGRKVICVLGNHEFVCRGVKDTLDFYKKMYKPSEHDVHYLDVVGHMDVDGYRFIGNVLWYDGSTRTTPEKGVDTWYGGRWFDAAIPGLDFKKETLVCQKAILESRSADRRNILVTHTCPDARLNLWQEEGCANIGNAFSGVAGFLSKVAPHAAICGHTHRRVCRTIGDTICVNPGNDYYPPFNHFLLEL